jgi:UDP-N-acetyl-D-mannosaminuronic acid dehydrogenase
VPDTHPARRFGRDVVVIGGCGRVGLPLAIAFADRGARVGIYDVSQAAVTAVNSGSMPFAEPGAAALLARVITGGRLSASAEAAIVRTAEHVIVVTGPPEGRPEPGRPAIVDALSRCARYLTDGQLIVLRSTVPPGTTAEAEKLVADLGIDVDVAFCPERVAEGRALAELAELPQLVSSRSAAGLQRAGRLFSLLTPAQVPMSPEEAELAKLFANAWRYVTFAMANQLYMIANDRGLDFERIRRGLMTGYPRAAGLPGAGLAAGPCLLKDTAQLADACGGFSLGRAAVAINEGMPGYLVGRIEQRFELPALTVGILGMAFKGGSDDVRASLSYPLKRLLAARAAAVVCTDPHVRSDPELRPLPEVLDRADLLVIAAPHPEYRRLGTVKPVVDLWNLLGKGVQA